MDIADTFLRCIALERGADVAQTTALLDALPPKKLALKGLAMINLTSDSIKTGLGGKTILQLQNDMSFHTTEQLSNGDIRTGDIVRIDKMTAGKEPKMAKSKSKLKHTTNHDDDDTDTKGGCEGVVTRVSQAAIVITVNEEHDEKLLNILNDRLWIVKIANSVTYKRMESIMRKLKEITAPSHLVQLLLNQSDYIGPSPSLLQSSLAAMKFHDPMLNDSQRNAINFSLSSPISIIHGPPGTGKTYTLVETIRQCVSRGERVLVCGPSNISVDTILERLTPHLPNDQLLRIGHPARLLRANLQHCLDIVSTTSDGGQLVKDIKDEIDQTIKKIKKSKSYKEKKLIWQEVKLLRKELREREKKVLNEIILQAKVIVTTLHGSSSRELNNIYTVNPSLKLFDTIIIDEVSQSLEPQCWIPLISHQRATKLILAGDNQQLPPTIKLDNDSSTKHILETTLFDRLVKLYGNKFKMLLNVQYRMNTNIMTFSSMTLYNSALKADPSVSDILLFDLDVVDKNETTESTVVWYDTQGGDYPERDSSEDGHLISSKFNEMEAYVVNHHLNKLLESGVSEQDIGIIAPYNAQVSLLKSLIHKKSPGVEISTVDGFQGREKQAIILTLVRSNDQGQVGFLADKRRLNVAITRPKRQLCIVGDMETIAKGGKFLKSWCNWCEDNADIIYPDLDDIL